MLAQRIITAIIMVAVFLLANFWLPEFIFILLISLLLMAAAWEWARLAGLEQTSHKVIYTAVILLLVIGAYFIKDRWGLGLIVFGALC